MGAWEFRRVKGLWAEGLGCAQGSERARRTQGGLKGLSGLRVKDLGGFSGAWEAGKDRNATDRLVCLTMMAAILKDLY